MTNFTWIDGSIVGLYLLATMIAGIAVRKYVGKVEHFLVAGREMNLYLGIASLAATEFGIVTCMYTAQLGYEAGFAGATPGLLYAGAMLFVGLTGFCIKPLRDSGVITIPELFQNRFGSRVRWLSGVVIVLGGLLNMGVFLRMGGDFLVQVGGLEVRYLVPMMGMLLAAVAIYTMLGGMLSVLVTDFLQFVVMSAGLLIVTLLILYHVGWTKLAETVGTHYGAGGFNPFVHPKMGIDYVVYNALVNLAAVLTWQTIIQRLLASKDTRTGRRIYTHTSFFFICRFLIPAIWGIAALSVMAPDQLAGIFPGVDEARQSLLAMPRYLSTAVPLGLMGLLVAAMLAADMSTDSAYMLTWGGVIYNDILAPFRRTWTDRKGILINRAIIAVIGVFLFFFGLYYDLKGDVWTYLTVTGSIYLSSMSVLLIACCYWKRANNWGAFAAIVIGAIVPISLLVLQQTARYKPFCDEWQYVLGSTTYAAAAVAMIIGSLLKPNDSGREALPVAQAGGST
jgi:SSS family solute:Na+ symporter